MAKPMNYKIVKISILPLDQPSLFDRTTKRPSVMVSEALLKNPTIPEQGQEQYLIPFGIIETYRLSERSPIIAGKVIKGREIELSHLKDGQLTEHKLAHHPSCQFYFSEETQIAAFQSARINRNIGAFLKRMDRLLSRELRDAGLYVHSEPLRDPSDFVRRLNNAERVDSVWFTMIPPNGYKDERTRALAQEISAGTRARQFYLHLQSHTETQTSINPAAPVITGLIGECREGNGHCGAQIIPTEGASLHPITTKKDHVVRQLVTGDIQEPKSKAVARLLAPLVETDGSK